MSRAAPIGRSATPRRISEQADRLNQNPLLDGFLLEDQGTLASGTTKLPHKAGRKLRGVIVVKTDTAIDIPQWDATNPRPESELWLVFGAAATVTLWVF